MIQLKSLSAFPNWPLALEFLHRSQQNFLLAEETPPLAVPSSLKSRIILRGTANDGSFPCVPPSFTGNQVTAICAAIHQQQRPTPQSFIGSIRGSNFVAFLNEFAKILKGKFELREVAQVITNKTRDLFEAEGASILVPNERGTKFRFAYFQSQTREVEQLLDTIEVPGDRGVTGWVARHRKPILINDAPNDPLFNPDIDHHTSFRTRNILATHISIGDNLIAILQVVNKLEGNFEDWDLQIIELIASIIAIFIEKASLYDEKVKFAMVRKELEIAHSLQTEFLPTLPAHFGRFRLSGESRQVSKVGGDFWDIADLGEDEKLVIIGDVSGHGLGAAVLMSAVRTATRVILPQIQSPRAMVEPLNRFIHKEFGVNGHFVTMILCHLNTRSGEVHYFRAGHEYPIRQSKGRFSKLTDSSGLPVGILPFRQVDEWGRFNLAEGDSLLLYTDGVLDGLGEQEQEKNLAALFQANPSLMDCLEQGLFFETIHKSLHWKERDDATLLKLSWG